MALGAVEAHESLEGVSQFGNFALQDEVVGAGFEGGFAQIFLCRVDDGPDVSGRFDGLESFEQSETIEAGGFDVEDESVGLEVADGDEGIEGVLEGGEVEAPGEDATEGGEDVGVFVDGDDFGFSEAEDFGDWVTVLSEEVEHVEASETEVTAWGTEVSDFTFVGPVVDGLEIDLAEPGDIAGGEEFGSVLRVLCVHLRFRFLLAGPIGFSLGAWKSGSPIEWVERTTRRG